MSALRRAYDRTIDRALRELDARVIARLDPYGTAGPMRAAFWVLAVAAVTVALVWIGSFWLNVSLSAVAAVVSVTFIPPLRRHLRAAWGRISRSVGEFGRWLDGGLLWLSSWFGVFRSDPWVRRCRLLLLFGGTFALAALGSGGGVIAWVALLMLIGVLVVVVAVSRAWAHTEKLRGRIVKQISPADTKFIPRPESKPGRPLKPTDWLAGMPDLRATAGVSALMLIPLVPLLCMLLHQAVGMFPAETDLSYLGWSEFVLFKTYVRSLPEFYSLLGLEFDQATSGGYAGMTVLLIIRLMLGFIVVQAIRYYFEIQVDIKDAVEGVKTDPGVPVLLGARTVGRLIARFGEGGEDAPGPRERGNIAVALGRIGEPRAFEHLDKAARDPHTPEEVRARVAEALGRMGRPRVVETLKDLLDYKPRFEVREAAAHALGLIRRTARGGDAAKTKREAARALLAKLESLQSRSDVPNAKVLKAVLVSVGRMLRGKAGRKLATRAKRLILDSGLLNNTYRRVRNKAATAVGLIGDAEAAGPVLELLRRPDTQSDPRLIVACAEALGRLLPHTKPGDATRDGARTALGGYLERENDDVTLAAADALSRAGAADDLDALLRQLDESFEKDKMWMTRGLARALKRFPENSAALERAERAAASRDRAAVWAKVLVAEDDTRTRAERDAAEDALEDLADQGSAA